MSAAFKNSKKKLSQQELRKLMNEHKGLLKKEIKRIDSPLAKYSDSGQLMCVLCKSVVRSEAVWPVHINAKQHKENIALAKKLKEQAENKRPISPSTNGGEPSPKKLKSILKNAPPKPRLNIPEKSSSQIPEDFFDSKQSSISSISNARKINFKNQESEKSMEVDTPENVESKEILPEGFFDDPIKDAKARNLEYKDPIEEEWEKFQKEIKSADSASAAIIAEDQEEATTERQIDEIDEQIRNWARVLDLERKKETIRKQDQEEAIKKEAEESSGEDSDFDEYLDWRAKKSFK